MLTRRRVCASYFESSRNKFRHLTFPMQTLRKKNSPCKFKKEPTRFLGEGVSFKAKLIGILEVSEARGDRMCQAALADLKMAIRAAGEHKQRIAVQVSIDGLRLRDEKTGECLYHHPVHKISFIAQDMSDSRAFGYIFGSPDTGHRFFGIKTDKAANQVVIAMRDLFQVVFELKKKEIELTKQNIEQNASKFHISGIFVEPAPDTKGAAGTEICLQRIRRTSIDTDKASSNSSSHEKKNEAQSGVIADLLDLQFELNSLQQGIHQMDKITPDNPRPSSEDPFDSDPFGDSFANMKVTGSVQPILPPPPFSSKRGHLERQQTIPATPSSATSSPAPHQVFPSSKTPPLEESIKWLENESEKRFSDGEIASLTNVPSGDEEKENGSSGTSASLRKSPQIDVFTELDPLGTGLSKPYIDKKDFFQHLKNPPKKVLKDLVTTNSGETFPTNFDITLDPLDPIKVHSDVARKSSESFEDGDFANFEKFDNESDVAPARVSPSVVTSKRDSPQQLSHRSNQRIIHHQPLSVSLPPEDSPVHHKPPLKESSDSIQSLIRLPSPKKYQTMKKKELEMEISSSRIRESMEKSFPVDFSKTTDLPASPLRSCSSDANSRLSSSSAELDIVPEPPPRGAASILINPPPLPPKKQGARGGSKPPPRPPHTDSHLHYDFLERRETSPSPTRRERTRSPGMDDGKQRFDDNFSPPSPRTLRRCETGSSTIIQTSRFDTMTPTTLSTLFRNPYMNNVTGESTKVASSSSTANTTTMASKTKPSLDITLSQLTSSNLDEFATSLDMSVSELTNLTLQQLTECLARLSAGDGNGTSSSNGGSFAKSPPTSAKLVETSFVSSEPLFKADFEQATKQQSQQAEENPVYDKYAVFRELLEMEQLREENSVKETEDSMKVEQFEENKESTFMVSATTEIKDRLAGLSSLLSMGNLSVELPPLNEQPRKSKIDVTSTFSDRISSREDDVKSPSETRVEFREENEIYVRHKRPQSGNFEAEGEKRKSLEDLEEERLEVVEKKGQEAKAKVSGDEIEGREDQVEGEEEEDDEEEEDEDEEDEEEEEEEEEDEETLTNEGTSKKSGSETKPGASTQSTKDRYAALREIGDDSETKTPENEEKANGSLITSPIQTTVKSLAEHDLLKLFSEPTPDRVSPRKELSRNEEDLRAVSTDIFEEIRMLNSGMSNSRGGSRASKEGNRPTTGFEDVFCPFDESKQENKDGRESTGGSVKDDGNWAKFESSGVFNSDKSSYEDPVSVGGTSPWSPDEKEFQTDGDGKTSLKMQQQQQQQQPQHRLHSGESDNEWKDEEESEGSSGRRQMREARYWSGRYPRLDMTEEGPYYEEAGEKERHFYERERDRGGRKTRGGPWPKQPGVHRTRDSSPWHEEPSGRSWPREEDDPQQQQQQPQQQPSLSRGRYDTGRKLMSGNPYKDEEDESSKGYWKCRTKQRPWNGDREGFRNPNPQPVQPQGPLQPSHFPGDPIFYEEERAKRRMMLWSEDREEERERDRFSSQESMGYDDEERWPRREYDRRRDRWEEENAGGNRFWPRRTGPGEIESRGEMRIDPRSEYGPLPSHEIYRKQQHYCRPDRADHRERTGVPHEMYPTGPPNISGCWPEDEYSLPLPITERADNSPRYLTRKRHWPKRPNSANDERNIAEPVYADPRAKYGMSRSECSDNDAELYHRPYRSRSRESYWGSDQEFESWTGSGNERLYWSEGPDAKSETLHRRRMNRHKNSGRTTSQKNQSSPFEDDFTESVDRTESNFEAFAPDTPRGIMADIEVKQSSTPRNVKEHLRKDTRTSKYGKQISAGNRGTSYFDKDAPSVEVTVERPRISSELKSTPEDFPSDVGKVVINEESFAPPEDNGRDSFFNGNPSPGFDDDDAFAFKSEMADSVPETTNAASMSMKNSRQIKYGNNKIKGDHDIKKSESVNIFVRESDPFDDDDFFK